MERFAFSLSAESKAWLEDQADELDITQADVMRLCVRQARRSGLDNILTETLAETAQDGETDTELLRDRVGKLEDRIETIQSPDDRSTGDGSARGDADNHASDADDATADDLRDQVTAQLDDVQSEYAESAIIDTIAMFRDHGPVTTGDVKAMLDDDHTDHYESGEYAWKSIADHVEQIDGVHQPQQIDAESD